MKNKKQKNIVIDVCFKMQKIFHLLYLEATVELCNILKIESSFQKEKTSLEIQ